MIDSRCVLAAPPQRRAIMTELMDPTLAARALSAATEITSTALSGDDPGAVLDTVVARAAELADADLGLAMVSADDGRVVVEAAHYATAHPTAAESARPEGETVAGVAPSDRSAAVAGTAAGRRAPGTQAGEPPAPLDAGPAGEGVWADRVPRWVRRARPALLDS